MNRDQAIDLLRHHSTDHPLYDHPKSQSGFLGMLRPYGGPKEENYHEVMSCLRCLADELRSESSLDRSLISALWGICYLSRLWALDPDGMLRRNNLISDHDLRTIESWVDDISWAVTMLLDGQPDEVAFEPYEHRKGGEAC